jgi:hypothetical protein
MRVPSSIIENSSILFKTFLLVTMALIITACNNARFNIDDGGLLSEKACSPPCFARIIPGITSKSETIKILRDLGYWDNCSITKSIVCEENLVISINDNDTVRGIGFSPTTEITLEQVIGKYGEPDSVVVFFHEYPDWVKISVFFKNINARLDLDVQDGDIFTAKPSNEVTFIAYMDNISYENSIKQGQAQKWSGYREYKSTVP